MCAFTGMKFIFNLKKSVKITREKNKIKKGENEENKENEESEENEEKDGSEKKESNFNK